MKCRQCPAVADPYGTRCAPCRDSHNAREKARRQERQRKHRCWVCGGKASPGERTCKRHQKYRAERAAAE